MRPTRLAAAALLAVLPGLAAAQSIDDAIAARRGFFSMLNFNLAPLAAMAKGDKAFDAAAAKRAADNLTTLAALKLDGLFPAGSSNEDKFGETAALPAIWTDQAGFGAKAKAFREGVAAMAAAVEAGPSALGKGVQTLGAACADCHRSYRAKD